MADIIVCIHAYGHYLTKIRTGTFSHAPPTRTHARTCYLFATITMDSTESSARNADISYFHHRPMYDADYPNVSSFSACLVRLLSYRSFTGSC